MCTVFMAQSRNRFSWSKWQSSTYIARVSISTSLASKNPHVAAHANDACFIYTCSADARSKVLILKTSEVTSHKSTFGDSVQEGSWLRRLQPSASISTRAAV